MPDCEKKYLKRPKDRKYMMVVFLDIKGPFDRVWWPTVKHSLIRKGIIPIYLYKLIESYLSERTVSFTVDQMGMLRLYPGGARKNQSCGHYSGTVLLICCSSSHSL